MTWIYFIIIINIFLIRINIIHSVVVLEGREAVEKKYFQSKLIPTPFEIKMLELLRIRPENPMCAAHDMVKIHICKTLTSKLKLEFNEYVMLSLGKKPIECIKLKFHTLSKHSVEQLVLACPILTNKSDDVYYISYDSKGVFDNKYSLFGYYKYPEDEEVRLDKYIQDVDIQFDQYHPIYFR